MGDDKQHLDWNAIHEGDARELIQRIAPESVSLSVWSPPYYVGKSYEQHLSYEQWRDLVQTVLQRHEPILKPGGFVAVNIADILCFPDHNVPRFQAENTGGRNRLPVTREDVLRVFDENPGFDRYQVAEALGVSEQTVDRRMKNNNIRGGKHAVQTRVRLAGPVVEDAAYEMGLYLYDRRIWAKDPCWENSKWHTNSYRGVDEFEYIYIFWKPGITKVDRNRLERHEWSEWGSRGVWHLPSVRANGDHEAKFPPELPRRLIRLFTDAGDLVLDPFIGSGTTAVAAAEAERHYLGFDLEPRYVKMAKKNLAGLTPVMKRSPKSSPSKDQAETQYPEPATPPLF